MYKSTPGWQDDSRFNCRALLTDSKVKKSHFSDVEPHPNHPFDIGR